MKIMFKYLTFITLTYYLVKGLLYLLFWRAAEIIEEKGQQRKTRRIAYYKQRHDCLYNRQKIFDWQENISLYVSDEGVMQQVP